MSTGSFLRRILDETKGIKHSQKPKRQAPKMVVVNYTSLPVEIPSNFLAPLPNPLNTLHVQEIEFGSKRDPGNIPRDESIDLIYANIPENSDRYAVIIDNVLTEQECKQLIHMAELSAGVHGDEMVEGNGWKPAMVNGGYNREYLALDYRNSDRIVWDNKVVMDRIWERVMQHPRMKERFSSMLGFGTEIEPSGRGYGETKDVQWLLAGPNERMRFLKYGKGQFFKEHCDGCYEEGDYARSFYTIHVYLNDSAQALGHPINLDDEKDSPGALLEGGATSFFSESMEQRFDADPKIGRVLVFQQRGLLHSGDYVSRGVKYTMRSDLMYTLDLDYQPPGADMEIQFS
ncbi:hypothetical protein HYFRA_00001964 [Hymenoscyphus fraxineus]|uniref:Prolyl 4-hydroxylase alpha subunit domain-containing protein n=1 Tax=Hymenoscyphus fraxineus TaxID=746836 RepID=A0A9N9KL03_9HELO|nr:hypothetical protein HYFRA_00001964 [Hymenoscyphus fraxineus]